MSYTPVRYFILQLYPGDTKQAFFVRFSSTSFIISNNGCETVWFNTIFNVKLQCELLA